MNPIIGKMIDDAEADVKPPRNSKGLTCVKPEKGIRVFDWLNSSASDKEQPRVVARHLRLCLHCREAAANWVRLHEGVKAAKLNSAPAKAGEEETVTASKPRKATEDELVELKAKVYHGGE